MLFMYKRPGQRVILNARGHMMVCPTHMEASVQKTTAGLPCLHSPLSQATATATLPATLTQAALQTTLLAMQQSFKAADL